MTLAPYAASPAKLAHNARLSMRKMVKAQARPHGNYDHAEHEYATIAAINTNPPSVNIYLNGAQNMGSTQYLTTNVLYLASYVPSVGDVVVVARGAHRVRSSYLVLGKPAGAASPYPVPLGGINGAGQYVPQLLSGWGATAIPPTALGANGDWCHSANGHVYFKSAGAWTQVA